MKLCRYVLLLLALAFGVIGCAEAETSPQIRAFDGKRIGVFTGTVHDKIIQEILPDAKLFYFDVSANAISALTNGKIDAIAQDKAIVLSMERGSQNLTHIDEYLSTFDNAFIFTKSPEGDKLRREFNEFVRSLKADGTLKKIGDVWLGTDESAKTLPDYENYPAENGTIKFALDNETPPFAYIKDGRSVGYDVDVFVRFCKAKGYRPEASAMTFSAILPAVMSGKCAVGLSAITITPERAESVNFSEPVYTDGAMLLVKRTDDGQEASASRAKYTKMSDLNGRRIGVQTGVEEWADIVRVLLPDAKIIYYNTFADLTAALKSGKIDAFPCDSPVLSLIVAQNSEVVMLGELLEESFDVAVAFQKSGKGEKLKAQWDEFITSMKNDGKIDSLIQKWTGADENAKTMPDYSSLPATNGVLRMATEGEYPPFNYYSHNKLVGFEVELAVMFAEKYGYGLDVKAMAYDRIFSAVQSGRCDFALSALSLKEEHKEVMLFSVPYYACSTQMAVLAEKLQASPAPAPEKRARFTTIEDLAGKRIAVLTGTTHPQIAKQYVPTGELVYFDNVPDTFTALKTGKVEAICTSIPIAKMVMAEDDSFAFFGEQLTYVECAPIFAKTETGRKLCEQFSSFLKEQWDNGTIQEMDSLWFGSDESKRVVKDYTNLPSPNGVLKMAAEISLPPFIYVKDNKITGYDVDTAVRFCEANGYGLEIVPMNFSGVIPSVVSGKCDFGLCGITRTAEREESVLFSYPNCRGGNAFVVRKADTQLEVTHQTSARFTKPADLAGKRVGVQTGTTNDKAAAKAIPDVTIDYFDSFADILVALRLGKIDAACLALNAARFSLLSNEDLVVLDKPLAELDAAPIFAKTDAGKKLCEQFNKFIKAQWDNGTFQRMDAVWFGRDESKRTVKDYADLPAPNGTLKMGVDTTLAPFAYVKDNRIVGYEVEMAVKFCEENGYGLEVVPMNFSALIPAIASGKIDFASCTIAITAERAEQVLFASPNAKTGNVLVVRKSDSQSAGQHTGIAEMSGKRIGVRTGSNSDLIASQFITEAKLEYYDTVTDIVTALKLGKIDAMCTGIPIARYIMIEHDDIEMFGGPLTDLDCAPVFAKTPEGEKLCAQLSEFINAQRENGTLAALDALWFSTDDARKTVKDYAKFPAPNGILKMAVDPSTVPFAFMKDGKFVGYDVDMSARFCEAYGYGLEIVPMNFAAIIPAVQSGKCDFAECGIAITPERAEQVLFGAPNAKGGNCLLVLKSRPEAPKAAQTVSAAAPPDTPSFLDELAASFNRTFIRENRWRLFVDGIISTMIITVLSIICGTVLGFAVYMFCRGGNVFANLITRFFVWLIQGMPMVVLLMILYYIIFGKVDIAGIWVAVIAFSMTFGAAVYGMICSGVNALDRGQTEAAYALGFSDSRTFFTVILPQAALHFMPAFKGEVVALIKATAIVGYIAVQDLTKMGDIVRSRTYEAFFPLIAVAVIYFVLAGLLNVVVSMIHSRIRPETRSRDDILRGIDTHDKD